MSERYRFIEQEKANYRVRTLCRVMQVSRSGFYDWCGRSPSNRSMKNARLATAVKKVFENSEGRYGYRRVTRVLRQEDESVGKHRVARLMREAGLAPRRKRKFRLTTDSAHTHPVAENLLDRQFEVRSPNQVWAGDITYVWTRQGWLYLAVLIDLYSRRVIGWAMGQHIDQKLTLTALEMALAMRQPSKGFLHHTDRGSQYAASAYRKRVKQAGGIVSMSRKGNCWDNAPSEAFFSTLKTELVHRCRFLTRQEARSAILRYLLWFNAERLHSSLDYATPMQFERLSLTAEMAA